MSSSLTTRLQLYKPNPGTGDPVDVSKLNQALDKIDAAIAPANITSSTRPATPYTNQVIRESDTGKLLVWEGSSWAVFYDPSAWAQVSSPTLTWGNTGGTQPSLGNGLLVFRYQRMGRSINFMFKLVWGTTTTGGDAAGFWNFGGLPASLNRATSDLFFPGGCYDSSGPNLFDLNCQTAPSGATFLMRLYGRNSTGSLLRVGPVSPFTWASGDILQVSGTYEGT